MIDRYGRELDYLRVSVTDFCNFRCKYCMPEEGVKVKAHEDMLSLEEIYYIVRTFVELGVRKVRITGGEPLVRPGILGLIKSLGNIEKIEDLCMTTNGSLLKENASKLKSYGLNRVNISLDTLDKDKFYEITKGNLDDVLEGIEEAINVGMKVKINAVLLKDINEDEIKDLIEIAKNNPIDLRFIEAMPIGETKDFSKAHFLNAEEILERFELIEDEDQEKHSSAKMYRINKGLGRVGLIRPLSDHFCNECNRLRLTSDGKIKSCLHGNKLIDLKTPLRKGESILPYIKEAVDTKPKKHKLNSGKTSKMSMNRIGG